MHREDNYLLLLCEIFAAAKTESHAAFSDNTEDAHAAAPPTLNAGLAARPDRIAENPANVGTYTQLFFIGRAAVTNESADYLEII